ncbi:MAG: beta-ketoacyl-ACP synthase III, partial [Thermodesulfobacteriota bacterium]
MSRARITGTGSYAPQKVLMNKDLEKMVDTTDKWISMRTGIRERRVSEEDTTTVMAINAGRRAIEAAGCKADEIGLVVVGTVTPEMVFPSTACYVQSALGLKKGSAAFDVSAACSGFLYAMDIAEKYLKSGVAAKALVIGVDQFSKILDWEDRSTCVLFGDGAGAVVLEAGEAETKDTGIEKRRGLLASSIHSDGKRWDMLYVPGGIGPSPFEKREHVKPHLKMNGNETFKVAVRTIESALKEVLDESGLAVDDITLLIPHQANIRIIKAVRQRLGLPEEKVYSNVEKYGNTSAASIPIALDEAVRKGAVKKGDIILFVAFGGG